MFRPSVRFHVSLWGIYTHTLKQMPVRIVEEQTSWPKHSRMLGKKKKPVFHYHKEDNQKGEGNNWNQGSRAHN